MSIPTVLNWSSGKDAALAFYLLSRSGDYNVQRLLTTVSEATDRIVMHGVRREVLEQQALLTGLPLRQVTLPAAQDDAAYRDAMRHTLEALKAEGIRASAFGDIFLEDLRQYREQQLATAGLEAVFPLWKRDTRALVTLLEETGIRAVLVCVNERFFDAGWLGREVNREFLAQLPEGVDPCGENGEFHTLVVDAPFFREPLTLRRGGVVHKKYAPSSEGAWDTGFYFLDMELQ